MLIGVGSSVSISIRLGEKNEKEASNLFTCASLMILGAAVLIGSVLFFAAPFLMRLMGADAELAALAVQYLRVYAVFSPLTTILFAVDNYLRICGKIRTSMALNIFMAGMCALLEFLFLYVFRFGIWGAALGTCISMSLSTLIAFYPFFRGRLALKFCRPRFSARSIRKTLSCGCPVFLNNVAGRVASILMNTILLRLGGDSAVSVYGILMYVDGFIQPLLYGMCDSLQPAVGFNWGARDYRRVTAIEKRCFTASGILSLVFSAVIFFFPAQIAGLFTQGGEAGLLEMAIPAVTLFSATYVTRWISFASQSFMSAIEKPLLASWFSGCADSDLLAPGAYRPLAESSGNSPALGNSFCGHSVRDPKTAARHGRISTFHAMENCATIETHRKPMYRNTFPAHRFFQERSANR